MTAAAAEPADPSGGRDLPPEELPTYVLSRWLFLRLLGLVYLIAFVSLAVQLRGLIGEHGILPAGRFLDWAYSMYHGQAYRLLPTVFWLGASDAALVAVAWTGAVLALLLVLGVAPLLVLALLWVLYLSLSVVGQEFLSFQWDALLLEAGLLSLLWAPASWLTRRRVPAPSEVGRLLLVFLLFKLMFLSGVTKLLSGDPTWRNLTALDYHFETQPLPPWTAWYADHLPSALHRAATLVMFVIELGAPWLVFARRRRVRHAGVAALAFLQLGIAATGNYGFFNLLALVLCIPLLDDRLLGRVIPLRLEREERKSGGLRTAQAVVAAALMVVSLLTFAREIAYTLPGGRGLGYLPRWSERMLAWVGPFRTINGYGLFRVMTTERPELVIEGSRDGVEWRAYEFRWKPGDVDRRPRFVAPYQPRLDWQMWFAALDPLGGYGWLQSLGGALRRGTPEVLALLGRNPFSDAPPRFVRLTRYIYRFSGVEQRRRTGAWWVREPEGHLPLGPSPPEAGTAAR
ncbi:MAG TPA: lipase maturation factor family protein [Gemmatimonadales bacterium]|nr:lipase maturation factor family protein [Gemmatimonadales bacterium]